MAARTLVHASLLSALVLSVAHCSNVSGVTAADAGACAPDPIARDDAGDDDDDDDDGGASRCKPGDQDGVIGGCYAFDLTVDDTTFTPIILKAQNLGEVTLNLTNKGTKPHDFVVDCLPTPNVQGCPPTSCFDASSKIGSLAPGASGRATFVTPNPEGIYLFHSDVPGDFTVEADGGVSGLWGQFVVQ